MTVKHERLLQDRYRIIRPLGSGGFGAVSMAEDTRLGRVVAIKEMDAARLGPDERAVAAQLFEREARMLAALDHPGLTRIWDYFEQGSRAYLVMEYVPGQTLRELVLQQGGPLDEGFVLACALQLCDVLIYLHTRRPPVIFRDLKPANVMVLERPDDRPLKHASDPPAFRLIDFGIARFFKPDQAGDTLIIGTPGYAPPEQYGHGQTDQRSDIYSLGVTLFYMLSGQSPASGPPAPLGSLNPAVSPELARVVKRATARDPADRYAKVEDMRHELRAIAQSRAATSRAARPHGAADAPRVTTALPLPTRAPRPRPSSPMALAAVVLVVLGSVALGAMVMGAFGGLSRPSSAARFTPAAQPTVAPASQEWLLPGAPGTIAFGQRDQNGFDVWAATLDGTAPRRLTNDGRSYGPAFSSDGRSLAITRGGDAIGVYLGDAANPLARQLDLPGMQARYPAFSPDGRSLAVAGRADGGAWKLAIVDLAGGAVTFPPAPANVGGLAWSPGRLLAFAAPPEPGGPQDLFVIDAGGVARNVTNTPEIEEDFPAWSPDGRRLAFAASPPNDLAQRQIFVANADGSGSTQLTAGPGPHTNPAWSPDGSWIAYVAQENSADWQVWAMRADGGAPRQMTFSPQRKFYLAWGQ